MTPDEYAERKARLERKHLVEFFLSYVMRDEHTGGRIQLSPDQRRWQELIETHQRLILWGHPESGKSSTVAIGRVLYEIGKDPMMRVAVISNTQPQALKIIRSLSAYIQSSDALHEVYPHLVPGEPWTEGLGSITVQRPHISKDPTVQGIGVHGALTGSRIDLVIIDDILDFENTSNPAQREKLLNWFTSTVMTRLTAGARVILVGNCWHKADLLHLLATTGGWYSERFPVCDLDGNSRWPEGWPPSRIEQARSDMQNDFEFERQFMCKARSDADRRFKAEYIELCKRLGDRLSLLPSLREPPSGCQVLHGVDLAGSKKIRADKSVIFSVLTYANRNRRVLMVNSGRWDMPEILHHIRDTYRRYGGTFIVESNGVQIWMAQQLAVDMEMVIPVVPHWTGSGKLDPSTGVEAIAAELAAGRWIIPSIGGRCDPEVQAWIEDMDSFDPAAHTGDYLMASYFVQQHLAMRERTNGGKAKIALYEMRDGSDSDDDEPTAEVPTPRASDPVASAMAAARAVLGQPEPTGDPLLEQLKRQYRAATGRDASDDE